MRIQAVWISKINISRERVDIYKVFFKLPVHGERKYSWVKDPERPRQLQQLWQGAGAAIHPQCPRSGQTLAHRGVPSPAGISGAAARGARGAPAWAARGGGSGSLLQASNWKQSVQQTLVLFSVWSRVPKAFSKECLWTFKKGSAPFQRPVGEPNFQKNASCYLIKPAFTDMYSFKNLDVYVGS